MRAAAHVFSNCLVQVISGSGSNIEVEENSDDELGLTLAVVTVMDLDSGNNGKVGCRLNDTSSFRFVEIYLDQFHISLASSLDREQKAFYSLAVHCHDVGDPPLSSSSVVSVRLVHKSMNQSYTF